MTMYIQLYRNGRRETVDEFDTFDEALAMVEEYRLSDLTGCYYISRRACSAWSEK